jgi:glycosyltransferase involved in cell wall biosynthesis
MNIWYISKYASSAKYNAGTRHFYLGEEWVKTGNDVTIISSNSSHLSDNSPQFKQSYMIEVIEGVRAVWLNIIKSKSSSGITRILGWFLFDLKLLLFSKKNIPKPDVIIVSSLSLTTVLPGWILSKWYKSKFVFEVRDIWPLSAIVLGGYSKYHPFILYLSWLEKLGYRSANLIVGTMPNLAEHVNVNYKIKTKTITIPQGVSLAFFEQNSESLEQEFINQYIPKDKFIVCYAGTMNENNPLDDLIKAAKILKDRTDIFFIFIGGGSNRSALQDQSKELTNVVFPPLIAKGKMTALLNLVDVCYDACHSELATYGLSRNKWIDYMYSAKPIICSYDGFQSMINEAKSGTFVKFGTPHVLADTILELSAYPKPRLCAMGIRAKEFIIQNREFSKLADTYLREINAS